MGFSLAGYMFVAIILVSCFVTLGVLAEHASKVKCRHCGRTGQGQVCVKCSDRYI